ncbi:hypothetical protein CCR78_07265 [Rhodovulum imhoffii]|nr:hypothetical protein [Rhodovulum imhoffii]
MFWPGADPGMMFECGTGILRRAGGSIGTVPDNALAGTLPATPVVVVWGALVSAVILRGFQRNDECGAVRH